MYGRLTRLQGSPGAIEKGIADFDKNVARPMAEQPGFKGIVLLVNREKGEALSVTYWQDEEAMNASEALAARTRKEVSAKSGTTVGEVTTGQILDQQRIGLPKAGSFIRLNTVDGEVDKLDAAIKFYQTKVVPVLKGCAGFRAAILSVNRTKGRMIVSTVWNSAREREASDSLLLDLRRESGNAAGARNVKVELFESVFVNMPAEVAAGA